MSAGGQAADHETLRVWVDAQLPPALARWLQSRFGVSAEHVQTLGLHQADDAPIFHAARDAADVVVTKDDDFVRLVERIGPPPQVLWLRCGNVKNGQLRQIITDAWPRAAALFVAGEPLVEVGRR